MFCAACSLSSQRNAEGAINFFASIVNCNWPIPPNLLIILIMRTSLLTLNWIKFLMRDYNRCHLLRGKATIQKCKVCKIKQEASLQAMISAAQTVRTEVSSCKKLTKLSEIASIFVNSLIAASSPANVVILFGRQWLNFKSMLFSIALSLVVISVTMKISKRWPELNSSSTLNTIAQK